MVTLKASYIVKPAQKTPNELMYLSEFDQFIAISHAPTVYFYRSTDKLIENPAQILKESLSKALVIFYPLAGRLQWVERGRLELNCNSMGAMFLEADSEAKIDDFKEFCPTSDTRALLPSVDYDKPVDELPLLLVQLTKFSCGGISLGMGISHILADGYSAAHFFSEWARIARGEQPKNLPVLDRTILQLKEPLPVPSFDHSEFSPPPLLIGFTNSLEERKKETTVAMLKLSKEQIEKLKSKANQNRTSDSRGFTRFEVVTAHMWRCACKARGHESEQLTRMRVSVDVRRRMEPPLPKWYFGNAVLKVAATTTSGELQSKPFGYASGKIREAIEKVTDEYIKSSLAFLKSEPDLSKFRMNFHLVGSIKGGFHGNPNIDITSWTTLPFCGVDFGWGKEIHLGPGPFGFDGKSFILIDGDEDDSFIVALHLQVAHMDAFKKFFYDDI